MVGLLVVPENWSHQISLKSTSPHPFNALPKEDMCPDRVPDPSPFARLLDGLPDCVILEWETDYRYEVVVAVGLPRAPLQQPPL